MRSFWAFVLSSLMVVPQLPAQQQRTTWVDSSLKQYKILQQLGPDAYLKSIEKDLKEPLDLSDKKYLKKILASSFKQVPPLLPELKSKKEGIEVILDKDRTAYISTEYSQDLKENIVKLNGKFIDTKNKNIEAITRDVWVLLSRDYNLGPYPEETSNASFHIWNFILPRAEAGLGTIGTVLVFATIIGALVYFTKKVTKSTTKAIEQVGASTSRGIDRVSGSAANAVDKVGDEAANTLRKTGELTDAAKETVESHKK